MFGFDRIYVYGALILASVLGFSWFVHSIRKDARDDLIQSIERTEDAARKKAVAGARSVDACHESGGVFSQPPIRRVGGPICDIGSRSISQPPIRRVGPDSGRHACASVSQPPIRRVGGSSREIRIHGISQPPIRRIGLSA